MVPQSNTQQTKKKTVYFVRHGESEGNVGDKWQDHTAHLTPNGREQAALVGGRFVSYPIDIILSSSMARAVETADIIADRIKKPIETSDLFIERRRPKEQLGVDKKDPKAVYAEKTIISHFDEPGFRFSDEENFDDLKKRALELLDFLAGRPEQNILVIGHGFFMRIVIGVIAMGETLTPKEGEQYIRTFHMRNTGVTIIQRNEGDNKSTWDLCSWNDYSHLVNINS